MTQRCDGALKERLGDDPGWGARAQQSQGDSTGDV